MAYFTPDFMAFLNALSEDNSKAWFDENRKRYKISVKDPFYDFLEVLIAKMAEENPDIKIKPKDAVFRINRDIRFSKDKRPYKTHMGAVVSQTGRKNLQVPGMYLHFGVEEMLVGGGMHMPDKEMLYNIRAAIADKPETFQQIVNQPEFVKNFGEIRGEKNKRLPKEFQPILEVEPLIANKQFYFMHAITDPNILLRDDLVEWLVAKYQVATPLVQFLERAIGR